jgi:PAS domain S-box-containing protein
VPTDSEQVTAEERWSAEEVALLESLPPSLAGRIRTLLRDRDHYLALHAALIDVERAKSLDDRLRLFVHSIQSIGYGRVGIAIREGDHDGPRCIAVGMEPHEVLALSNLRNSDSEWRAGGMHVFPLRTPAGHAVATLVLGNPVDDGASAPARLRTVELFAQQVVHHVEQIRLSELTARQAERLQRLQTVGSALARSLDEREIALEVARGVSHLIACDSVVVVHPDLERATVTPLVRLVAGDELPLPEVPLGEGVIARVARTGQPVLVAEPHPAASELIGADALVVGTGTPVASLLAVPLRVGLRLVAVLAVASTRSDAFGDDDADLLLTMGAQAASALSNARLYAESQRERRQTEALADVARAVSESLRMGEVLRLILRHAMSLLGVEGACVALRREDYLHVVAAAGTGELLAGLMLPVRTSISGRAVRDQTAVISNSVPDEPDVSRQAQRLVRIRKTIIVPLSTARGVIGTLCVFNRAADFEQPDARVLQRLADHVAVAIVNARLYEELAESTREWTVAFNAIPTGMVVIDDDGRILRYNSRALQLGHFETHRELVGRQFYEAILAEPRAIGDGCPLSRALQDGVLGRETIRSTSRGLLFDVVASPHPNGGAVVTFDDVTAAYTLAERNRLVLETANDGILVLDPQRRISFANPAAMELLALRGDIIGTPLSSLVAAEHADELEVHASATFDGEPRRFDSVIIRADGERRNVAVSQAALRDVTRVAGIVVALRDVTEERRARDAVAHSEARYRNIFETATDPLFTLDTHGGVSSSNDATCALFDVPREELLGRPISGWVDVADRDTVASAFRDANQGRGSRFECTVVRASGERRRLFATITPIRHGGRVTGVLVLARDITEDRERDAALARSQSRYAQLVESASDAIFTIDTSGHFTSVNRALEIATGRSRDALLGSHFNSVVDPRDREGTAQALAEAFNGRRQRVELRYLDVNGVARPAAMLASPLADGGAVTGVLGVVRDVSEEKLLVEQLVQQEKLAAIGQLVSGVAHELNNPLASVIAFSQLVMADHDDVADRVESLQTIHNEAKRAAKIVSNLLTFARQHPPQRTTTVLNDVIRSTLDLRRYALTVHGVELVEQLDPSLPAIWADPFQLQQVFLNLLGNAEQALSEWDGDRRIAVTTEARAGRIVVTVRDSGPGIAASEIDRVFNPFYTTKSVGKGTGLGLSVSDGIVREHGGSIRVESSGGGAAFVVELPIVLPPGAEAPAATDARSDASSDRSISMLVVDDEPAIRSAIVRYFTGLGHTVDAAGTGAEAHALLGSRRYDALLLDLRMPDTSGDAIYRELLERDPHHAARVIFLTGDVQSESTQRFLEESGRASVMKPFTFDELLGAVLAQSAT